MEWDDDSSMLHAVMVRPRRETSLVGMAFGMSNGIHCIDQPLFFAPVKCW